LGDYARTRAIFELGVKQTPLSYPENLWKAYIDFEFEQGERERCRALYERLVGVSGHVKVWRAFAEFEAAGIPVGAAEREDEDEEDEEEERLVEGDVEKARAVFMRGYKDLKGKGLKEEVWVFHEFTMLKLVIADVVVSFHFLACRSAQCLENVRREERKCCGC
jgi:crooked neck